MIPMRKWLAALVLALVLVCPLGALAAEKLAVQAPGSVRGYQENALTVTCPGAGQLTLTIEDDVNVYRVLACQAQAVENTVLWDGLCDHLERLPEGEYRIRGLREGMVYEVKFMSGDHVIPAMHSVAMKREDVKDVNFVVLSESSTPVGERRAAEA